MLRQLAAGVLIHESESRHSNAVVVQGRTAVLLIDPRCGSSSIRRTPGITPHR